MPEAIMIPTRRCMSGRPRDLERGRRRAEPPSLAATRAHRATEKCGFRPRHGRHWPPRKISVRPLQPIMITTITVVTYMIPARRPTTRGCRACCATRSRSVRSERRPPRADSSVVGGPRMAEVGHRLRDKPHNVLSRGDAGDRPRQNVIEQQR